MEEKSPASLRGMQLLFLIGFCVLFGSSAGIIHEQKCYGHDLGLPFRYGSLRDKGSLYFTPNTGQNRSRQLLIDNGKVKDPRITVSYSNAYLKDLKKTDEGIFSLSINNQFLELARLKVLDCADEFVRTYGEFFTFNVPIEAEYLEFTPLYSEEEPELLWNRTNPRDYKGGKVRMASDDGWIESVTQSDSGFYDLRKKDNTLLSRKQLIVEEEQKSYQATENKFLSIPNPRGRPPWTVIYTREADMKDVIVVYENSLASRFYFDGRLHVTSDGITIYSVESRDAGIFKFKDSDGNLAKTVRVTVVSETLSAVVYIGIIFAVVVPGIVCCCCVIKCCRRKSAAKREESAPTASYHIQNQPAEPINAAVPAPDYSYRPANTLSSGQLATPSSRPPAYTPLNIHVNQPQPQVAPLAPAVNSNFLSSESEPKFELKGTIFSSASLLSSDSTHIDVYNSDKLNFL